LTSSANKVENYAAGMHDNGGKIRR
jgi:hypothetical protein